MADIIGMSKCFHFHVLFFGSLVTYLVGNMVA